MREEHDDEISEDVSEKLWSVLGTAVHNIFEETAEGEYISEERIFFDVNGWTVSGAIDIQKKEPDGSITMKPENDEVLRLKLDHKKSTEEIRKIIKESSKNFKPFENWK